MKTGVKFFVTIAVLITICAFTTKKINNIKKAEWLIGTWENETPRGSIYETWNKISKKEFSGKSYIIKEKDTIVFENIQLLQEHGNLLYIPVVKNQNDGLPVRFTAKEVSQNQLVFENLQHDFPQIISYTKISSDSLVAIISGTKNGQEREQTFQMKRVK